MGATNTSLISPSQVVDCGRGMAWQLIADSQSAGASSSLEKITTYRRSKSVEEVYIIVQVVASAASKDPRRKDSVATSYSKRRRIIEDKYKILDFIGKNL
jgi:hypothetical protein